MLTVIGAFSVMGDIWADQIDQSKGPVTNSLWLHVHGHQGPTVGPCDLERVPCFVTCRYIMGICSNIIIISTLLFDVIIYRSLCRHCDDDGDGHDSDDSHGDEHYSDEHDSDELLTVMTVMVMSCWQWCAIMLPKGVTSAMHSAWLERYWGRLKVYP